MTSNDYLYTLFVTLFLSFSVTSFSQDYIITKEYFTVEEGLSSSQVRSVYQDSKGFIWFTTSRGVDRYDGYEFINYNEKIVYKTDTPFNIVHEDVDGNIWLSYKAQRLTYDVHRSKFLFTVILNPLTNENLSFEDKFPDCPFQLSSVSYMYQDDKRHLWMALSNGQAWVYDGQFRKVYDNNNKEPILTVSPSDKETFWIGIDNKIIEVDQDGRHIDIDSVSGQILYHRVDIEGTVWLYTTTSRLSNSNVLTSPLHVKYRGEKAIPFFKMDEFMNRWPGHHIHNFKEDQKGRIWFTTNKGVLIFDKSGKLVEDLSANFGQDGSNKGVLLSCFSDDNLAWFTSVENKKQGIFSLNFTENPFKNFLNTQSPPYSLRGITQYDDSTFCINTYNGNVDLYLDKGGEGKFRNEILNGYGFGYGIIKTQKGEIFSGYHGAMLSKISLKEEPVVTFYDYNIIGDLLIPFVDTRETFWIGGTLHLGYMDTLSEEVRRFDKINSFFDFKGAVVCHFYENEEGVWLSTNKGLFLVTMEEGIIAQFNNFPSNDIAFAYEDEFGIFWLGTSDKGLIKWDRKTNKIRNFKKEDGLSDNTIHAILPDDFGNLWMSSNYGLMRFNKSSETINSFFEKDGITSNEFNKTSFYQGKDGTIYFGGLNGLTVFHPKDFIKGNFTKNKKPSITKFEKLDIATGKLIDQTKAFFKQKEILLSPDDKSFIVSFATLDFSHSPQRRYAYKIEDLDKKWVPVKENFIRVNQLPYGSFTLKIKSMGDHGTWSEVLSIPIQTSKPFYLKSWFILAVFLAGICLVWSFIRFRTYRLRKRTEALTIEVFQRTKVIENQKNELERSNRIKDKFLSLIGHDLKTPLIALNGLTRKLNFLIGENRYEDISRLSNSIDQSSSNMTQLLDDLMNWALLQKEDIYMQPQILEIKELITEVNALYQNVADVREIKFQFCNLDGFQVFADKNAILTILRNLFDNAIKYTPVGQKVVIQVLEIKQNIHIQIENFGSTIKEKVIEGLAKNNLVNDNGELSGRLGLLICKELAEKNNGSFSIRKKDQNTIAENNIVKTCKNLMDD